MRLTCFRTLWGNQVDHLFSVRVSESFLTEISIGAIEAYVLGDGRKKKIETFGHIFATTRNYRQIKNQPDISHIHLEKFVTSLSARRNHESVMSDEKSRIAAGLVAESFMPQLSLIGDLHTHPYEDLSEVKYHKGWEFSDTDYKSFLEDDWLWEMNRNPVHAVVGICRLKRVRETDKIKEVHDSIWQFDVYDYRLWLNVAVGYLDAEGERASTIAGDGLVALFLPGGANDRGARLFE